MAAETRTIHATIAKVNATGFQTQEDVGRWLNLSKYASPAPTIPPVGTPVAITLDAQGFVRAIEPVAPPQPEPQQTGRSNVPPGASGAPLPDTLCGPLNTRLACLGAAATFLAMRPEAKSADVVKVATSWEAWATR